jgi:protocatechuate 3,4-dioxygenase beta subunit
MNVTRRDLLAKTLGAIGAVSGISAVAAVCGPTHRQTEGPYYPEKDLNRDGDLTQIHKGDPKAKGEVILLTGKVTGTDCKPLAGLLVEIWQAAASGKYNHSGDTNHLPADPNFQYWGRCTTTADGDYTFLTVIPGYYPLNPRLVGVPPSGPDQYRPPHIHFKVHAPRGFLSLTTQMYFDPKTYDDADLSKTVSDLNRWESVDSDLMVRFSSTGKVKTGTFDIVLKPLA